MLNSNLIVDIILRLSIVLLLGWLGLRLTAKQNPRWSVLMTRFLIVACLGLPVVYLCLPTTTLAVLPAQAKGVQATKASSIEGNAVLQQSSWIQALDHTSDVVSKPVIVGTESSLREPAEREAVTTVLVPQSNVNDLRVSASDPFTLRNETSRSETLVNDSTGATVHLDATTSHASGSLAQWLGICWLAGCVLFLLKIGIQFRRAKLLLRTSTLAPESIQRECNALATKLALRSIPQVCVSTAIKGPCTAGLLQPMIFLPQSWSESLSEQERRAVLMHELSHIADRDSLWDLLSRIVTALWWFHPLVWRLAAQHRLACEHMSDARAAASTAGFDAYRQMLAQWALRRQGAESNTAVLAMADRSFMLRRLKWLEVPRSFETLGRLRRTLFLLIAVLMFLGVASVKFIPQASAQQPEVRDQVQTTEKAKPLPAEKNATEKKNAKQDEKQKPAVLPQRPNVADIDTSQTTPRIVRVVDQNDQPIAGAKVSVGWWEDNEGDIEGVLSLNPPVTNEKGEVTIQVPRGAARAQLSAQAPGFASAGKQYALSGEPTLILKPGRIIRVKAVDTKGRLLNDAYPLLEESNHFGREFKRDKGLVGYFTSPVVGLERRWMRVVDGSGEGPILFSDLIDVTNPEQVTQDGAILATLYAGIRLEGRLDDSVPRPIKNGCVELYINEGEKHRIGGGWVWQDTALVQEDGTFVFDSLPAGGHVQLFALVDGYQSTRPSAEALTAYLQDEDAGAATLLTNVLERQDAFWPQLFPLPRGLYKTEVELPCTLSTSLDLKLLDPAGRPISEASVNFNPNGLFISGELFIPTTEVLTQASLVRHKDPVQAKRLHEWANATFLNVESDEKGIAHVRNLPTHGRQTFQVTAPGFMLPAYPSISMPAPNRYALIDLKAGKTLQRTITMEKLLPISSRQVMVMNRNGDPVPNIKVTVSEIAFAKDPDNWEFWSVSRFGAVASETTGQVGQVWLRLPLSVDHQEVARLRIEIQGRIGRDAAVRETLVIPRIADGREVVLFAPDQPPKDKHSVLKIKAKYVEPGSLLSDSPEVLLKQLLKEPSLVVLNRLLELAKFDAATPLRFRSDLNWTDFYKRKENERVPVVSLPTEGGERVVVLCDVRPKDATWQIKPEGRFPPAAAFVFNPADGSLIRMIGGWASSSGSYNNLMLTNQGGTDDYFISTSAFETHGPFEYIQRWYRVGQERQPALTVHNYANATSRDGKDGPSSPLAEYGYVEFGLNGKQIDHARGGTLPDGALVPRKIYWDGVRNLFIGPVTQSYEGQPLYQVVTEDSAEFKPLDVKPDDIIAGGGRRYYQNWHWWDVVIPAGKTAQLRLFLLHQTGKQPAETQIAVKKLAAGLHFLQLQLVDSKENPQSSNLEIRVGSEKTIIFTVPRVPISNVPSVEGVPIARTAPSSILLFDRPTDKEKIRLVWKLTLQ